MACRSSGRLCACVALAIACMCLVSGTVDACDGGQTVVLDARPWAGEASRVRIELKAHGLFRPGLPPGGGGAERKMPKPLMLEVETRLIFHERVVVVGRDGRVVAGGEASAGSPRIVRQLIQAASAINGEIRPAATALAPELGLLIAEKPRDAPVVVASLRGPLSRSELELVEGPGDPLSLIDLMPGRALAQGDRYKVSLAGAAAISGYDVVTASKVEATLVSFDAQTARVQFSGRIEGRALGGAGAMMCNGYVTYDRRRKWLDRLEVNRAEVREPGPIEAGLDVKSTLSMKREQASPPATLSDASLSAVSLAMTPSRLLLRQAGPGGKSSLLHDRRWHVFWEDPRVVVLKRLEGERVIAQLNLSQGPSLGPGRAQEPAQFQEDVKKALKDRFSRLVGMGEVAGDPSVARLLKVGVLGREGSLAILWYYYLASNPQGDQVVGTFALPADDAPAIGREDELIMGSFRFESTATRPPQGAPVGSRPAQNPRRN